METENNDTIYDEFLYIIDKAIEQGDPNILQQAIKIYKNKISNNYIKMAEDMYNTLVIEKIDLLNI